jgi:hypothetical protein
VEEPEYEIEFEKSQYKILFGITSVCVGVGVFVGVSVLVGVGVGVTDCVGVRVAFSVGVGVLLIVPRYDGQYPLLKHQFLASLPSLNVTVKLDMFSAI